MRNYPNGCNKIPDKRKLRKGGFILTHRLRVLSLREEGVEEEPVTLSCGEGAGSR